MLSLVFICAFHGKLLYRYEWRFLADVLQTAVVIYPLSCIFVVEVMNI